MLLRTSVEPPCTDHVARVGLGPGAVLAQRRADCQQACQKNQADHPAHDGPSLALRNLAHRHKAADAHIALIGGSAGVAGGLKVHPGGAAGVHKLGQGVGAVAVHGDGVVAVGPVGGVGHVGAGSNADGRPRQVEVVDITPGRELVDMDEGIPGDVLAVGFAGVLHQVVIALAAVDGQGAAVGHIGLAGAGAVVVGRGAGVNIGVAAHHRALALQGQHGQIRHRAGGAARHTLQRVIVHVAGLVVLGLDVAVVEIAVLPAVVIQDIHQFAVVVAAQVAAFAVAVTGGGVQIAVAAGVGGPHHVPAHRLIRPGIAVVAGEGVVVHVAFLAVLGEDAAVIELAILSAVVIHDVDEFAVVVAAQIAALAVAVAGGGVQVAVAAGAGAVHLIPAGALRAGAQGQGDAAKQHQGDEEGNDSLHMQDSFRGVNAFYIYYNA